MTRPGDDYETFVYEKFSRLLPDAEVTKNDRITGSLSGLAREIDVSVRLVLSGTPLLYILQCKDYATRPTTVGVLDELSSVMRDVEAAKGFLLCTSGFARSNHDYALRLGIELVTVEDMKSERWHTDAQLPVLYRKNIITFDVALDIQPNEALIERNRTEILLPPALELLVTNDGGKTPTTVAEYVDAGVAAQSFDVRAGGRLDLSAADLMVQVGGVWAPCPGLTVDFTVSRRLYMKYVQPDAYSQLRDHVREEVLPLHIAAHGTLRLDDSYIELPADAEPPVFTGFFVEIDEWPQDPQMAGADLTGQRLSAE